MTTNFKLLAFAACLLSGCAHSQNGRHADATGRSEPNYFAHTRTLTGSNVPTPRGELPVSPVSATTPANSLSREKPSLYPTEPVAGRTPNTEPGTRDVNTGAGPAGSNPVLPIDRGDQ